jgi:DNA repair protein RecO (recombination protein O)
MALLEAVDQVAQEGEPNPALFRMLTGALRTLGDNPLRPPLLVGAFYWKLLALEGVMPVLDECVQCGTREVVSFDPAGGGTLCRDHRRGTPIDPATIELVQRVVGGQLAGALEEPSGPPVYSASHLATATLEAHLERRLRAVHLLGEG